MSWEITHQAERRWPCGSTTGGVYIMELVEASVSQKVISGRSS